MKKIGYLLEYLSAYLFGVFVRIMPLKAALWTGRRLGDIAFFLLKIRRRVVLKNLLFAFPNKTPGEIRAIALETYRNSGMSFVEFLRFPKMVNKDICDYVEFEGLEYLDRALSEKTGVVLVGAHFGNWEMLGAAMCKKGYPLDVLAFKQHNDYFNGLLDSYRKMMGIGLIQLKFALRTGLKALKNGRFVAFLADQDAGRRDGIFVDFFGRPASTNRGAAVFALKAGSPVILGVCVRDGSSLKHKAKFIPVDFKSSGDFEEDVRNITAHYTKITEGFIKKYPSQWFWYHKRWKTPASEDDIFY